MQHLHVVLEGAYRRRPLLTGSGGPIRLGIKEICTVQVDHMILMCVCDKSFLRLADIVPHFFFPFLNIRIAFLPCLAPDLVLHFGRFSVVHLDR